MNTTVKTTLAVIAGIAAIAIGAFTHQYIEQGSGTPQEHLDAAFTGLGAVKSLTYESILAATPIPSPSSTIPSSAPVIITLKGGIDGNDQLKPKSEISMTMSIPAGSSLDVLAQPGEIAIDARMIEKTLYLKLLKAPDFGFFNLKPVLATWIKFDLSGLAKQYGTKTTAQKLEDPQLIVKAHAFRDAVLAAHLITITKTFPNEAIGGESNYHYGLAIDKPAVIAFLPRYRQFMIDLGAEINEQDYADAQKILTETPQEAFPTGEIWITRKNSQFKKIKFIKDMKPQQDGNYATPGAHLELSFTLNAVNQPLAIETPAPFITMEEAYTKVMGQFEQKPSTNIQERNTQRSANVNAILNAIGQNMADNRGIFVCAKGKIPTAPSRVMSSKKGDFDIASCLVPTYLLTMPFDPSDKTAYWYSVADYNSGYIVSQKGGSTGKVTVSAPSAEGSSISVTR